MIFYSAYAAIVNAFRSKKIQQKLFHSVWFIWALAAVVIVYWILRNIPVYPFHLLQPRG